MAGLFISFFTIGDTLNYIFKLNGTRYLCNNYVIEWIPGTDRLALVYFLPIFYKKGSAIRNIVRDQQAVIFHIHDPHLACPADHYLNFLAFIILRSNGT